MTLGEYLVEKRTRWDWVMHDCSRWLDRWIVSRGHRSPIRAANVRYSTELGAARVIRRAGGLLPLWTLGMIEAGIPECDDQRAGDFAILSVDTDDGTNEACGIWTGKRWATLYRGGLAFGFGDPLLMWRI